MKIEFDTASLTAKEAGALSNFLAELYGQEAQQKRILQMFQHRAAVGDVSETKTFTGPDVASLVNAIDPELVQLAKEQREDIGPDPRTVFGQVATAPQPPAGVQSIADAGQVPTAPTSSTVPSVPVPSAPSAQQSPLPAPAVDSAGMPWDARIHASTKTQNADGRWKKLRGVADSLVLQVEAELRGVTAAPIAPAAVPVPPPPVALAAPADAAPGVMSFADFMRKLSPAFAAGTLTREQANDLAVTFGYPNLIGMAQANDKFADFLAAAGL